MGALADPLDVLTMGGVDAGQCDGVAVVLSSAKVEAFKRFLDPTFAITSGAVASCKGLAPEELAAWSLFYQQWKAFSGAESGFFGASADWNTCCAFAKMLDAWRSKLESSCTIPGPAKIEVPPSELSTTIKWGVVGLVALSATVAAVVFLGPYAKALR